MSEPPADTDDAEDDAGDEPPALEIPEPGLPTAKVDYLYRIYCARRQMPSLDDLLDRLIRQNPYNPEDGYVFPPSGGFRRLQDALGASEDYFLMGYLREEAPGLWEEALAAVPQQGRMLDEPERVAIEKSPLCVVIRAQIESPENNEFIETLVHLADALRDLCHGVVWDVYMRKMFSAEEWRNVIPALLSPLSHVTVGRTPDEDDEARWLNLRTHGLLKFGSADLEVMRVPEVDARDVEAFLLDASEHLMEGDLLEPDEIISYRDTKVRVVGTGAPEEGQNEVLRLVDAPWDPDAELPDTDGSEGAPRLIEAIRQARIEVEGRRARGGLGAS